ncbi:hypothetical protein, partial [Pedobacter glucosidilyticus]|uniref:hypothetical protein n=1 Tax=Pedobacter glucosidilyticus TaxID=1122941 RepID=UPI001B7FE13E
FRRNDKYSSALIFVSFHQGKERSRYPARVGKSCVLSLLVQISLMIIIIRLKSRRGPLLFRGKK